MKKLWSFLLGVSLLFCPVLSNQCDAAVYAYVANSAEDTVSVIDTSTNKVIHTIPVAPAPFGVVVGPNGKYVYVTHQEGKFVSVINTGSLLFSVGDLKDSTSLAVKLRDASDPLSLFLQEQFSSNTWQLLSEYDDSSPPSVLLQSVLMQELNQLLQGPSLYDEDRFAHVTLSQETQQLIEQSPKGKDLIRLNRLLLEEAYPHEIEKSLSTITLITTIDNVGTTLRGLDITPDGKLYVADEFEHRVYVIDTSTNKVIHTIPVAPAPFGVVVGPNGKYVYVTHQEGKFVSVINTGSSLFSVDDLKDSTSLAVKLRDASDPLSLFLQEQFSSNTRQLLSEYDDSSPPSVLLQSVLMQELNQLLQGPSLYDEDRFAHVTLSRETQQLIEQSPEGKDLIRLNRLLLEEAYPHEIEKCLSTITLITTIDNVGTTLGGLDITPDGKLYVADEFEHHVHVIDTSTKKVIHTIDVDDVPFGVVVGPNGKYVYVTNQEGNSVSVISTGSSLFSVDDLKDSTSLAVKLRDASDPLSLFLQEQFSSNTRELLSEYDDSSPPSVLLQSVLMQELNQLLQGPSLYDEDRFAHVTLSQETQQLIEQSPEGKDLIRLNRLLLEEAYPHEIAKSLSTITLITTIDNVGTTLMGLDITPDGKLYVADKYEDHVYVIDTSTKKVIDTIDVGDTPISLGKFIGMVTDADGEDDSGDDSDDDEGGGCFIATAAFGSSMESHVNILRNFRDFYLLTNRVGQGFVRFYYTYSPPVADFIAKHESLKILVRYALYPVVGLTYVALYMTPAQQALMVLGLVFALSGALYCCGLRVASCRLKSKNTDSGTTNGKKLGTRNS